MAIGWLLIIIGFGIETNQEPIPILADLPIGFGIETNQEFFPIPALRIQADSPISYSWWMVILVTPFMRYDHNIIRVKYLPGENTLNSWKFLPGENTKLLSCVNDYMVTFTALAIIYPFSDVQR